MLDRNRFPIWLLGTMTALLLGAADAMAYVGPGAGMELVPLAMSLLTWIAVSFFTVLMWPLYSFMRWLRGSKVATTNPEQTPTDQTL